MFKKYFILFFLLGLFSTTLHAQNKAEQAIREVLAEQTQAWNEGKITDFMKGYWNSPNLIFVSKNGLRYGYDSTLKNYLKHYPTTKESGILKFELFQVKKLSSKYYLVLGSWHIHRAIGDVQGCFSLLFKKIKGEWNIVIDHSS